MSASQLKDDLAGIVGNDNVEDKDGSALVKPASNEEVASVVQQVSSKGAKLAVIGGFTTPDFNPKADVLVSMERMNKILEVDRDNMLVTVQAGMKTGDFQREMLEQGLYFPPGPVNSDHTTLGGNVATRASGANIFSRGYTHEFMLGVKVVLPTGEIFEAGGKCYKNVEMFDLVHGIAGSRGRFGIITELIFKVLPKCEDERTFVITFDSIAEASKGASELTTKGVIPNRLEIIDGAVMEKAGWPEEYKGAAVALVEVEGFNEVIDVQIENVKNGLTQTSYQELKVASEEDAKKLWDARLKVAEVMTDSGNYYFGVQVDPKKVPQAVDETMKTVKDKGFEQSIVIHGSASHIHSILFDCSKDKGDDVKAAVVEKIESLGGSAVRDTLDASSGDANSQIVAGLIKAFDPNEVMVS